MTLPLDALSSPAATHQGALERFTRDGGMVSFDDRVSLPKPPAVEHVVEAEPIGVFTFKGFLGPVPVFDARSRKGDP